MDPTRIPDNPYLLLTPGPLSTSKGVRAAMLRDWCTWDAEYRELVQDLRLRLVRLATGQPGYTAVLMQGSGTFSVEATVGSVLPPAGKLLVLANGAYGQRIGRIAERLRIACRLIDCGEVLPPSPAVLERALESDREITHIAVVHCETTSGILNPVREIGEVAKRFGKVFLVDAMSSFGGIPFDLAEWGIDFLVSSSNKCLQGVPGLGFVIARREALDETKGWARSLSLDLYDQWAEMEATGGRWRFTSPTHVVRALAQAIRELEEEGGGGKPAPAVRQEPQSPGGRDADAGIPVPAARRAPVPHHHLVPLSRPSGIPVRSPSPGIETAGFCHLSREGHDGGYLPRRLHRGGDPGRYAPPGCRGGGVHVLGRDGAGRRGNALPGRYGAEPSLRRVADHRNAPLSLATRRRHQALRGS